MPSKRRSRRRRRQGTSTRLDCDQGWHLQMGWCFFTRDPFHDDDHRRDVWEQFRAQLMEHEPGDHFDPDGRPRSPGTRPRAWWDYEAPGPRAEDESELAALVRLDCATAEEKRLAQSAKEPVC